MVPFKAIDTPEGRQLVQDLHGLSVQVLRYKAPAQLLKRAEAAAKTLNVSLTLFISQALENAVQVAEAGRTDGPAWGFEPVAPSQPEAPQPAGRRRHRAPALR